MDPTYPLAPIANFASFFLALIPLFTTNLLKKWNTGVCMFAIWVSLLGLVRAINLIVWSDNFDDVAPVWCDITSHLDVGSLVAIPACTLVITRRMYLITRHQGFASTGKEKRKEIIFDLSLCIGLPVLAMALYYIIQGARYQIYEEFGCGNAVAGIGLTIVLVDVPTILLPTISGLFYCPKTLWILYHQRKEMNAFLDSNSSMNRAYYYRIMILGCFDVIFTLPICIINLVTASEFLEPGMFWPGWSYVHSDFSVIPQVARSDWASTPWGVFSIKWDEWINPLFAGLFFLLFGLTDCARASYCRAFWTVLKPFGVNATVKVQTKQIEIHLKTPNEVLTKLESDYPEAASPGNSEHDISDIETVSDSTDTEKGIRGDLPVG